jgi:hypothetical protein
MPPQPRPQNDPLRKFYISLLMENPGSDMAKKWCCMVRGAAGRPPWGAGGGGGPGGACAGIPPAAGGPAVDANEEERGAPRLPGPSVERSGACCFLCPPPHPCSF